MGCCHTNAESSEKDSDFKCPHCGGESQAVDIVTVKSLVKEEHQLKVNANKHYKFCKSPDCNIVYFSKDPTIYFETEELKEKVTLKDRGLDVKICYCFDHTRQSVLTEIQSTGSSSALQDIKAKMKDPGCFCERSNPQGSCCLGNVSSWIKEAKSSTPEANAEK